MISYSLSLIVNLSWYFTKNWLISNFIGICFVLMTLRTIKLNNLKVSFILLSGLFIYDIFWVFISPAIFSGNSVMIVVATNLELPVKLVAPTFSKFESCSLLGLGDMVVPGLHMMYASRFGFEIKSWGYYWVNVIAYQLSLIGCVLVLIMTGHG